MIVILAVSVYLVLSIGIGAWMISGMGEYWLDPDKAPLTRQEKVTLWFFTALGWPIVLLWMLVALPSIIAERRKRKRQGR